jgi:hypothetical protein
MIFVLNYTTLYVLRKYHIFCCLHNFHWHLVLSTRRYFQGLWLNKGKVARSYKWFFLWHNHHNDTILLITCTQIAVCQARHVVIAANLWMTFLPRHKTPHYHYSEYALHVALGALCQSHIIRLRKVPNCSIQCCPRPTSPILCLTKWEISVKCEIKARLNVKFPLYVKKLR